MSQNNQRNYDKDKDMNYRRFKDIIRKVMSGEEKEQPE